MDGDNGDGASGASCEGVHTQAIVIGFHHGVVFHEHRRCSEPVENIRNLNTVLGRSKEMELERLSTVFVYKCDSGCHHLVAQEQCQKYSQCSLDSKINLFQLTRLHPSLISLNPCRGTELKTRICLKSKYLS